MELNAHCPACSNREVKEASVVGITKTSTHYHVECPSCGHEFDYEKKKDSDQ